MKENRQTLIYEVISLLDGANGNERKAKNKVVKAPRKPTMLLTQRGGLPFPNKKAMDFNKN